MAQGSQTREEVDQNQQGVDLQNQAGGRFPGSAGVDSQHQPRSRSNERRVWLAFVVVLILMGIVNFVLLYQDNGDPNASVSLSAYFREADDGAIPQGGNASQSKSERFEIRGFVQKGGKPVSNGKVKVTVQPWGARFRQSVQVDLQLDGGYVVTDVPAFRLFNSSDQLEITAEVASSRLFRRETVYRNYPLPRWLWITGLNLALLLGGVFLWAFTGDMQPLKNRAAIILSYCVVLIWLMIALVGPVVLIRGVPQLQNLSSSTPVGLIVAKLTEDSKPEWMLNIGGYRLTEEFVSSSIRKAVAEQKEDAPSSGSANAPSTSSVASQPVLQVLTLKGGIQVPLYVIILALIGGAINMTRQIPRFQSDVDEHEAERRRAKNQTMTHNFSEDVAWRKGLLAQYMYLISAPFLAIATYYLLILLGAVQPSIIVLVSFSIGLVSDTVVNAITKVAKKALGEAEGSSKASKKAKKPSDEVEVPGTPAPAPTTP